MLGRRPTEVLRLLQPMVAQRLRRAMVLSVPRLTVEPVAVVLVRPVQLLLLVLKVAQVKAATVVSATAQSVVPVVLAAQSL